MVGKLFALIGLWTFIVPAFSMTPLQNLSKRIHDLPSSQGSLIQSYTNHTQSYIYDQALAIIAFTHARDKKTATKLLKSMESLQQKDGSLYFSYYLDGKSPYPEEGDKRFAGAMAWVALAATHYQHAFQSKKFLPFNRKLLVYLESQINPRVHALRFSPTDIKETPWDETHVAALEHNLDAYAAFTFFHEKNPSKRWKNNSHHLKTFILSLWDKQRSHFWSGIDLKTGNINKNELYLDNQSWSVLALPSSDIKNLNMTEALELNCENFYVEHEGVEGFMDSRPLRKPASSQFVWSEGTAGQILAMLKWSKLKKEALTCKDKPPELFLQSLHRMKKSDGGVAYATTTTNPDFSTASSVAGTAWLYFASQGLNPFQVP